ncbi:hypothetical protein H0H93_003796 [Arthromyces matolae]|nr:hypothetical protein H0H93_003796 [Arthromyces matolae]
MRNELVMGPHTHDLQLNPDSESQDPEGASLVDRLRSVLDDKEQYRRLLGCQASDAQRLLDSFQWLLDVQDLDWDFRKKLIVATQRISARSGLYPACYVLKDVEQIGQFSVNGGGFADIYQGKFEGQLVCIKAIRLYQTSQIEHVLKQFAKEAILWGQLSHPNILPIFGLFRLTHTTRVCLVSQWMENGDITTYLKRKPDAHRLQLTYDVANGLWYLHGVGVIHGDLKGPNILIDNAGRARLADFGVSSVSDAKIIAWTSQTPAASKGGSTRWQAPELIDLKNDTAGLNTIASDIYAFGCVCYEVFTGDIPFVGIKLDATVSFKVMSGLRPQRPSPGSLPWMTWGLTEDLWMLMEQCWETNPARRPSSNDINKRLSATLIKDNRHNLADSTKLSPSKFRRRMQTRLRDLLDVPSFNSILSSVSLPEPDGAQWMATGGDEGPSFHVQQQTTQDPDIASLVSRLRSVFSDNVQYKKLLSCPPQDTQRLLDSFQRLLDVPGLDWGFRKQLIVATQRISLRSGLYPACYELQGVEDVGAFPHSGGGFPDIYKGKFQGEVVCIKIIRIFETTQIAYMLKQISKEAILWGQLSHPNILSIFGLFNFASRVCLVSLWMENGNIKAYLELNPDVDRTLLTNVLMDDAKRARLADFGLSSLDLAANPVDISSNSTTILGGNARWQAPELLQSMMDIADSDDGENARATAASDMFAFGCVCYEVSALLFLVEEL